MTTAKDGALTTYAELAAVLESMPLICRETRRIRRLSLRSAADKMGVSFSTIGRFENGEDARYETFIAVMKWLDGQQ